MRVRPFLFAISLSNFLLFLYFLHSQLEITTSLSRIKYLLDLFEVERERYVKEVEGVRLVHRSVKDEVRVNSNKVRHLLEKSRGNFIRIKGIQEKTNENLEEKIAEMGMFLGVKMLTSDIERAHRIGVKKTGSERVIVAELSNLKLKQLLIRKASEVASTIEFIVRDDVTNYMAQVPVLQKTGFNSSGACSIITAIGRPVTHGKSSTMFGAWMRDPADGGKGPVWVMRHFFDNRIVEEYKNMRDVARWRPRATHKLPYEWAGTGHVISKSCLYFNKFNSSHIVKYNLKTNTVDTERALPGAVFGNRAPYQWSGATDIDLALDKMGLWVIYATMENALDIVVSKLDSDNLEVLGTWTTNLRKQWSGNAFMACGVLFVMKKYSEAKTSLSYMYDTNTRSHKYIEIPFENLYEWNTMLSYNHLEKTLYAWDRGYLVTYSVGLG